tara:strand:- start:392 stop:571 length:180 start_codon:yes stop_codon:yes gene_type:complete
MKKAYCETNYKDRIKYLEDEYMLMKKTFADLVPVLDAIIESQKNLEASIKPLLGPKIIQ